MRAKAKENEYIIINSISRTARIIEIYTVQDEIDRLFLIKYPDDEVGFVFESQTMLLNQLNRPSPLQ